VTYPAAPRRSRVGGLLALLLALLFLAVLGAPVGFVAGLQVKQAPGGGGGAEPDGGGDGTQSSGNTAADRDDADRQALHEVTERDAKVGALIEVRYIKTNRSEAWICRDPGAGSGTRGTS
jgi:hypothetical protein